MKRNYYPEVPRGQPIASKIVGPDLASRLRILEAFRNISMAVGSHTPSNPADGAQPTGDLEALSTLGHGGVFDGVRILAGPHGPYLAVAVAGQHGVHFLDPEAFAYLAALTLFGGGPIITDTPVGSLEAPKLAVLAEEAEDTAGSPSLVPIANLIADATVGAEVGMTNPVVDLRAAKLLAPVPAGREGAQQVAERAALSRHSEDSGGATLIGSATYAGLLADLAAVMNKGCGLRVRRRLQPI